ncbi:hypothetical protein BV900_15160 [Agrobacterium tumefaciens]|nr:hypothetical protein BV900_15160 [Agrobacterium tumefaciens]
MCQLNEIYVTTTSYEVELVPLDDLIPHEDHDPEWVIELSDVIAGGSIWKVPIAAERSCKIVMDGHHRLAAARRLCLRRIPTVFFKYDDASVVLGSWRREAVTTDMIFKAGLNGVLLPRKTTRHVFSPTIGEIDLNLQALF